MLCDYRSVLGEDLCKDSSYDQELLGMNEEWSNINHEAQSGTGLSTEQISVISGSRGPRVGRELLSQTLRRHWLNIVHTRYLLRGRDMWCCHNWPDDLMTLVMTCACPGQCRCSWHQNLSQSEMRWDFHFTASTMRISWPSNDIHQLRRLSVVKTWQSVPSEMTWDNEDCELRNTRPL